MLLEVRIIEQEAVKELKRLIESKFIVLDRQIKALRIQGDALMAKSDEILAVLKLIDAATNEIAADLERLRANITDGMTAEQTKAVQDQLVALQTRLEALGVDPENPVP